MTAPLNLFPARIRFVNPDGTLTTEALRMLDVLVSRVGGTLGDIGADVFAAPDAPGTEAADLIAQQAEGEQRDHDIDVQQIPDEPGPAEIVMQPPPVTADQVEGLGSMAAQDIGTNFTGSFTGKTVTVSNGIITQVV
jgi:hypothetical protein